MAPRYFLAFLTFTSCTVAIESLKYALKGQEVSLKPDITANSADILWKHNGNKVVEFDGREELVYDPFESRITLDWHSAELTITDLSFEDSGNYDLEIFRDNKLHRFNYKLEVIENVAKPTISCEMNDDGESGTLACSAEPRQPQSLMKFEWSSHGNVLPGPQLIISLGQKHDDEEYSCHVSNPLSNETATFTAKRCYPENGPVAVIASVVSAVIVLLLIVGIVGVVFCRQTRRACFAEDGTENDSKNRSAPGAAGSDKKTAQGDETTRLLGRTPTLPSTQPLRRGSVNMSPNDSASDHEEDTGSDLDAGKVDDMDSEDQIPPTVFTGRFKEQRENFEQINRRQTAPKNLLSGSDKKTAQGDETTPLLDRTPTLPSTQPLGRGSLNMSPNDSASDHEEDTGSDLDAGKVNDMDSQDQMPPTGEVKECVKNIEQNNDELIVPKNLQTGSDEEAAQGDKTTDLYRAPTPTNTQPPGRGSLNMRPNDSASNHKEGTGSVLDTGKGSDKKNAQGDKTTGPLDGTPTLPSTQPLGRGNVNMSPNDSASDDKEDTGSHLDAGKVNDMDSQDQMPRKGEVKECVKNIEQNNDELIVPKNLLTGSDEEAAQGDKTTDLYRAPTPTNTQPPGRGSLNMRPNDSASNHKEGTGSVLDTGKGSDKKNAQGDKTTGPLGRTPTLPSTQALGRGNVNMSPNDSASNHKEDTGSDLDAGKVHDVDSQDQMPRKGWVKEQRENIEQINRRHTAPKNRQTGSDKKTAQGDETTRLLGRTHTLPSTQPLGRGKVNMRPNDSASDHKEDTGSDLDAGKDSIKNKHEKKASGPSCRDQNYPARNSKAYSDADQLREATGKEVPYCPNEPDPADVPTESSTVPQHAELVKKKEETEGAKSLPANAVSPTAQPCSPLTPNSPNTEAKDTAGEHEEDGSSDEISAGKCDSSGVERHEYISEDSE